MEELKKVGEDGITLDENNMAHRYNLYQVYSDLIEIGYTESKAVKFMNIDLDSLKQLKKEFEV